MSGLPVIFDLHDTRDSTCTSAALRRARFNCSPVALPVAGREEPRVGHQTSSLRAK